MGWIPGYSLGGFMVFSNWATLTTGAAAFTASSLTCYADAAGTTYAPFTAGIITANGAINANGESLDSDDATFGLLATPTTINFGEAADVNISVAGKTTTVDGALTVTENTVLTNGVLNMGVADTTAGALVMYGDNATTGASITLGNAANEDTIVETWKIDANQSLVFENSSSATTSPLVDVNNCLTLRRYSIEGNPALRFGGSITEGLEVRVMEEEVDLVSAGAKFVALSNTIPIGSVILSVQANIDEAVTAGGTTVSISIGTNGVDPDLYGFVNSLSQNAKIDTIPDWEVLGDNVQLDVCGTIADGTALGDTNLSDGIVRVRIVYLACNSLDDA